MIFGHGRNEQHPYHHRAQDQGLRLRISPSPQKPDRQRQRCSQSQHHQPRLVAFHQPLHYRAQILIPRPLHAEQLIV